MALNLFIDSFGVVQVALLTRGLDFRTLCKASIAAMVVSGASAVWMAWRGYGVWSLAAQTLIYTAVSTCLFWVFCPWRPGLRFRLESLRSLFGFGSRLVASGLLNTFFDRIQLAVIGKAFSAVDLGYYTRAYSTQQFPVSVLTGVVSRVTFPVFSQLSGDRQALKSGVRRALVSLMIPTLPMMLGLALVAKPFVLILFGPKWLPCVPYLQVLSIAGALWPMHVVNLNILTAVGRSDLFLRLEIIKKVLIGLGILATFRVSVMAMVWALLVVSVACVLVNSYYSKSLIGYGLLSQMFDLAPYAGVSASMGALTWAVGSYFSRRPVVHLLLSVSVGATFYCTACHFLRLEGYRSSIGSVAALCFKRACPTKA
jgi:O-antigen/teichoic acid export membrane protein